jgi:hypothetical protein
MSYVICIPSYKRAQICNEKTLAMLKKNHISKSLINVYVANQEEYDEYKKILDPSLYNRLIIGKKGIVPQRKFISDSFPKGKCIVSFDDDVKSVDLSMSKHKTLDAFFKDAFAECKKQKAFVWGVYPVFNPFFRKGQKEISTCLNYIVAAFYGYVNRPGLKAIETSLTKENGQKEDVEMSIKYFINDGIVLRFNRVGFVTKYYGSSGGLGTFDERLKPMLEASKVLKKAYPEYGEISTKKTGMTEFRLKKIPAHTKPGEKPSNNKTEDSKEQNIIQEKSKEKTKKKSQKKSLKKHNKTSKKSKGIFFLDNIIN